MPETMRFNLDSLLPSFVQDSLVEQAPDMHDCYLTAQDGIVLPAARFVVALYSPFLAALFRYLQLIPTESSIQR
jgi:hypothetical protein